MALVRCALIDHRGYAFVTFSAENEAEDAIDNMNMNELRGVRQC